MNDRLQSALKSIIASDYDIKIETTDDEKHIKSVEFKRNGYTSYIEVIKKPEAFAIVCFGDYKTLVFSANWKDYYIDMIDTNNDFYNFEKCETKDNVKEFDSDQFVLDAREYMKAEEIKITDEIVEIIEGREIYPANVGTIVDELSTVLNDNELYESAFDWGWGLSRHWYIWMAIIYLAQSNAHREGLLKKDD